MPGSRPRRLRAAAAALAFAAAGGATAIRPPAGSAQTGGGVAIRPADPGQAWLRLNGPRGAHVRAAFVVLNPTPSRQRVALYPADAKLDRASGAFTLADRGAPRQDVGAWARLRARRLVLAPGAQRRLTLTLNVPADASPGLHLGGVVAQGPGRPQRAPATGEQILVVTRLGLRVYVRVPSSATARARLAAPRVAATGWTTPLPLRFLGLRRGRRIEVKAVLANPSSRPQARLQVRLEVRREGRLVKSTPWRGVEPLDPGTTRRVALSTDYRGWHRGGYSARLAARDGVSELHRDHAIPYAPWGIDPLGVVGLALLGLAAAVAIRARGRAHR
jgi:hypothetical protein